MVSRCGSSSMVPGRAPMRVKRPTAREPFTLREKLATGRQRSVDKIAGRTRCRWVEFLADALLELALLSLRRPAHHGAGLHREQLGEADLPALFPEIGRASCRERV